MEILLLALLVLVFLGLPVLQMRKQSKQIGVIKSFQASLTAGMVVQLTSGLHGRVTNVGESTVDIEVAPGVITTWDRGAVLKPVDSVDPSSTEAAHLTGGSAERDSQENSGSLGTIGEIPDDLSGLDYPASGEDKTGGEGTTDGESCDEDGSTQGGNRP